MEIVTAEFAREGCCLPPSKGISHAIQCFVYKTESITGSSKPSELCLMNDVDFWSAVRARAGLEKEETLRIHRLAFCEIRLTTNAVEEVSWK
jgi:hypothetical protein